jgi:hypothetical protein
MTSVVAACDAAEVSDATDQSSADTAGFKMSRTEVFTLLGAVFGVLPLLFCAMRVMAVSGGDVDTLRTLVQNLDVKALVLATILPIGGTVVFWVQVALLMFSLGRSTAPEYKRALRAASVLLFPITVAILWAATPPRQVQFNLLILGGFASVIVIGAATKGRIRQSLVALVALAIVAFSFAGVITVLVQDDMWVPFERIRMKDGSLVDGYVLGVDGTWTRYMDSDDNRVYIVPTGEIVRRDLVSRP